MIVKVDPTIATINEQCDADRSSDAETSKSKRITKVSLERDAMPPTSPTGTIGWTPRRRPPQTAAELFVPVRSAVETVRHVIGQFEAGTRIVVLFGARGTGRSTMARRIATLWKGQSSFVEIPWTTSKAVSAELEIDRTPAKSVSRAEVLRVVDSFSLDFPETAEVNPERLPPDSRLLVVATTAWWLDVGRYWPARVAGVPLRRLEPDEIAHLINALRWMRAPNAPSVDIDDAFRIAAETDGTIAEVIRMASHRIDRIE